MISCFHQEINISASATDPYMKTAEPTVAFISVPGQLLTRTHTSFASERQAVNVLQHVPEQPRDPVKDAALWRKPSI
jgi:hypothetical protein